MSRNERRVSLRSGLILIGGAVLILALALLRPSSETPPASEASRDLIATAGEIRKETVHSATTEMDEIATESDTAQRTAELRQLVESLSEVECSALVARLSFERAGTASAQLRDFAARRLAENAGPPLATNCPVDAQLGQR